MLAHWPHLASLNLGDHTHFVSVFDSEAASDSEAGSETGSSKSDEPLEAFHISTVDILSRGNWPRLEHLDLSSNGVTNRCLRPLWQASWPQLATLHLSNNFLGSLAMTHLCECRWPALTRLRIDNNRIDLGLTNAQALKCFHTAKRSGQ